VATEAASRGCYFSINQRMLATDSGTALVRSLPTERLLTETDAPFTEIDNRKSEPRDVPDTAARLAQVRGVSPDVMKQTIQANAERVLAFAGISIPAIRT
jgi:TatD DNase family protein